MLKYLENLKKITAPFAFTSEHVQGPGGNTSVKYEGFLLIKASGYTFADVVNGVGIVSLKNAGIKDHLISSLNDEFKQESNTPPIIESIPVAVKPSMEFEFHSLLETYVLHTHSVYVNIATCSAECSEILATLFNIDEYLLIPYVTPGYPIAAALISSGLKKFPRIIFLKNHGIIVHGDNADDVTERYLYVQNKIKTHFRLQTMTEIQAFSINENLTLIEKTNLYGDTDLLLLCSEISTKILIPDQSIFFRSKVSDHPDSEIFVDSSNDRIYLKGTAKFIGAAKSMLQAISYIKSHIVSCKLTPDYISGENLTTMHALSTEQYRLALLKN